MPFNEYHQPAALPQLPFHGLTEYLATAYIDKHWTHVTKKIKSTIWNEDICKYLNDYKVENSICLNIEDECPQCNLCKVSTKSILLSSSSMTFITPFAKCSHFNRRNCIKMHFLTIFLFICLFFIGNRNHAATF